jgi:hypothetical protein
MGLLAIPIIGQQLVKSFEFDRCKKMGVYCLRNFKMPVIHFMRKELYSILIEFRVHKKCVTVIETCIHECCLEFVWVNI